MYTVWRAFDSDENFPGRFDGGKPCYNKQRRRAAENAAERRKNLETILLILIGVLLFALIIFSHELGHFLTAKWSGVRVNEFALGMGPRLLHFRRGETEYSLRLLPIGGYCAMEGEDEESSDPRAFNNGSVWKRILIVAAGAIMNVLLGIFLMGCLLATQDRFATTTVSKFDEAGSMLEQAGAQVGDVIVNINGYEVYTDKDLSFALAMADPTQTVVTVQRGEERITLPVIDYTEGTGEGRVRLDFYVQPQEKNAGTLIAKSFSDTTSVVRMVWKSLYGLVTGQFSMNDVAGPVGAAQAITQSAAAGLESSFGDAVCNIVYMLMVISVNLGVVNLLPLPALDGGRLLFLLIELIRRKPVPPKYEGWVHAAGFVLLMGLIVLITFNDLWRLFTGAGWG